MAETNEEAAGLAALDTSEARILLVDDNAQNLELLQAYLDELGCEVDACSDGIEALGVIRDRQPDLILLDIMMPRMSGYQLCESVKGDAKTRDIPVIMVTALSEVGDVERAVEFLFGVKAIWPYRVVWVLAVPVGAVTSLDLVWNMADALNAMMAIPNLIALLILAPAVFAMTRNYWGAKEE